LVTLRLTDRRSLNSTQKLDRTATHLRTKRERAASHQVFGIRLVAFEVLDVALVFLGCFQGVVRFH